MKDYKQRAQRLKHAISDILKMDCTLAQAYEIMAKEENFPNWDAMSGTMQKRSKPLMLNYSEQYFQLLYLSTGIKHAMPFHEVVKKSSFFQKYEFPENTTIHTFLDNIGVFDDHVVQLIAIAEMSSAYDKLFDSAMTYLQYKSSN